MLGTWRSRLHALLQGPRAGWKHRPTSEIQRPAWTLSAARLFASSGGRSEREKVTVELREEDLVESFVKGWGTCPLHPSPEMDTSAHTVYTTEMDN
jgi:hypothetical protein